MSPFTRGSIAYGSLPNMGNSSPIRGHVPSPVHMTGRNFNETASTATTTATSASGNDEEHDLVAQYARKLSASGICTPLVNRKAYMNAAAAKSCSEMGEKQKMIAQLESRNREVMRQIERLRKGEVSPSERKVNGVSAANGPEEDVYVTELTALRMRKEELEKHLTALQDSRKDLLVQLESLMKLLKNHGNLLTSSPSSAASTLSRSQQLVDPNSAVTHSDSFRIRNETRGAAPVSSSAASRSKHASAKAESVKNAMSSLVQELNSEDEAAIDELGLKLSKKLRVQSDSSFPMTTSAASFPTRPASKLPVPANNKKSAVITNSSAAADHRNKLDDFDEDELVSNVVIRNPVFGARRTCSIL